MRPLTFAAVFVTALVAMTAVDLLWLRLMKPFYRGQIGHLMARDVQWAAVALFYALFVAGVILLVVVPALSDSLWTAVWRGALLGLVAYAAYDLTNQATLDRWPWALTAADMAWGTVLSGGVAAVAYLMARWLDGRA